MEQGVRSFDLFEFPNSTQQISKWNQLKLSERMLFGISPGYNQYPQLVYWKCRQENLTLLKIYTFLNEMSPKIKLKTLWMEKEAGFSDIFEFPNFAQRVSI